MIVGVHCTKQSVGIIVGSFSPNILFIKEPRNKKESCKVYWKIFAKDFTAFF